MSVSSCEFNFVPYDFASDIFFLLLLCISAAILDLVCETFLKRNVSTILFLSNSELYGRNTAAAQYFLQLANYLRIPVVAWNADNSGLEKVQCTHYNQNNSNYLLLLRCLSADALRHRAVPPRKTFWSVATNVLIAFPSTFPLFSFPHSMHFLLKLHFLRAIPFQLVHFPSAVPVLKKKVPDWTVAPSALLVGEFRSVKKGGKVFYFVII